jgi:hypothetical protein
MAAKSSAVFLTGHAVQVTNLNINWLYLTQFKILHRKLRFENRNKCFNKKGCCTRSKQNCTQVFILQKPIKLLKMATAKLLYSSRSWPTATCNCCRESIDSTFFTWLGILFKSSDNLVGASAPPRGDWGMSYGSIKSAENYLKPTQKILKTGRTQIRNIGLLI